MEGFLVSVTLIYTLSICGFLLADYFNAHRQPSRYLVIGFWATCSHVGYRLLWLALGSPGSYEIPLPLGLLYPVLLYLFARAYYLPERTVSFRRLGYLSAPFLLHVGLFVVTCLQPLASGWITIYAQLYYVSTMVSLLTFGTLTVKMYSESKAPATATDILIRQLTLLCFGLVLLGYMVLYQLRVPDNEVGLEVRPMVYLFLALGAGLMIRYLLTHHVPIVPDIKERRRPETVEDVPEPDNAAVAAEMAQCAGAIERELKRTQLYLNPSVSLDMVAQQTGIPRHLLTQVFNAYYQKSFYQFIAAMRIEYAVRRISESDESLTLDALSYECGFNSKTSFNRYFKAYTGMTPSGYRAARQSITKQTFSISQ